VTVPAADLTGVPEHVRRLVTNAGRLPRLITERPSATARRSAVLILFGEGPAGPDVLLIEKSPHLRRHAGQPAFPGGGAEPGEEFPVGTALREAHEEAGVSPDGVRVLAVLPELFLVHSDNLVVPVVGWWDDPREVSTGDPREVARVARVPLAELVDPANRYRVRITTGYVGPAFGVAGMVVWGFTAALLDSVLTAAGLDLPWDTTDVRPLATPAGGPGPGRSPGPVAGSAAPTDGDGAAPTATARTVPGP
jgi:8-oxo-dGTP pyrophosphatase MutT (NUDIX family)